MSTSAHETLSRTPLYDLHVELGGKIEAIPTFSPAAPRCTHAGNPPGNLFCIHCGEPIKVDRTVRHYQVLRTLGQGGMGTTTLAWDREKAKAQQPGSSPAASLVVLKEMNADMAQIAKAQELFEREAKTLKLLNHPGIPKFFDFFVEGGKKYLVMELNAGAKLLPVKSIV